MKIKHYTQTEPDPAGEADAVGVAVRWVIAEEDGAGNFSMRVITVQPGGHTPLHAHPWEHEVFVLEGSGAVMQGRGEAICADGDVIFIAPGEIHQFQNRSDRPLTFICLIPNHP